MKRVLKIFVSVSAGTCLILSLSPGRAEEKGQLRELQDKWDALQKEKSDYKEQSTDFVQPKQQRLKDLKDLMAPIKAEYNNNPTAVTKEMEESMLPLMKERRGILLDLAKHDVDVAKRVLEFDQEFLKLAQERLRTIKAGVPPKKKRD